MKSAILYVDGASRGNPGAASIGVSLQDPEGKEIATISRTLGKATNNVAEYTALVEGLQLAWKHEVEELEVRADSELMVRQMSGEYRVKTPHLKPLWAKARELTEGFESFRICHVRREQNTRADELANLALDGEEG